MPGPGLPLVSAIVPNYNYERSLARCLRALQAQTYPSLEIIVADDRSTDGSVGVARALGVAVHHTPVNRGVSAARNLGAAHARGDVLFFVDSDVAPAPDAVASAVALLGADPALGAVCGVYEPIPMIRDSLVKEYRCLHHSYWMRASAGRINTLHTAMCAMPAAVFAEIGPFEEALRHSEDGEYGLRICRAYQVRSTTEIHGRHDHDGTLGVVLDKVFNRTRLHVPLFLRQRGLPGEFANPTRASGSVAALLALLTVPLLAVHPLLLAVPGILLALALATDLDIYRYVRRERGVWFLGYFLAIHTLANVAIAAGAVVGVLQCLVSRKFRNTYAAATGRPAPRVTSGAA
ncbi:MAG: glycosyltransferase family 2 protein [Dactylosporangium sp.]|nr:glycosyltransferase family 2 protein [Dactylosporangium sp.]NNJ62976.1 glycosyltransferase family 2 protein [Dactylosporangium sp.]